MTRTLPVNQSIDPKYDFSSNDYLGLSQHPDLVLAMAEGAKHYGIGSTGSRLLSGDHPLFHQLESRLSDWFDQEAALVFNSGYQMNTGILSTVIGPKDGIFMDRLAHASLVDGCRWSGAKLHRFRHNDMAHLKKLLETYHDRYEQVWMVTDSVFSMDGDVAPLSEMVSFKKQFQAKLIVDEAHALGLFGPTGAGCLSQLGLTQDVDLIVGTFGKSVGVCGAFVACSNEFKQLLVNHCRSFIYTTALPLPVIATLLQSIELIQSQPGMGKPVFQMAQTLREKLMGLGYQTAGNTQIVPVIIGDTDETCRLADTCRDQGFHVLPIRPPTVPAKEARLRLSITRHHTPDILDALCVALNTAKQTR